MVPVSSGSSSVLEDGKNSSFSQRHHHQKDPNFKRTLELGWVFIVSNIILEMLIMTFDQMASIQEPNYGWTAWELSLAVMVVCTAELVHRGLIKEKLTLLQCLKSLLPCSNSEQKKPYSFEDGVVLAGAKVQMALCAISYGCLLQGKESPVSASLVALIFIFCFVFCKFFKKQYCSRAHPLLPVRQDN